MQPLFAVVVAIVCLGCSVSSGDQVETVETDVPIYIADCRVECGGQVDTCDASWISCGKCGDPCDINGERGVCDTCCEGEADVLRCRPLE